MVWSRFIQCRSAAQCRTFLRKLNFAPRVFSTAKFGFVGKERHGAALRHVGWVFSTAKFGFVGRIRHVRNVRHLPGSSLRFIAKLPEANDLKGVIEDLLRKAEDFKSKYPVKGRSQVNEGCERCPISFRVPPPHPSKGGGANDGVERVHCSPLFGSERQTPGAPRPPAFGGGCGPLCPAWWARYDDARVEFGSLCLAERTPMSLAGLPDWLSKPFAAFLIDLMAAVIPCSLFIHWSAHRR
jgi:hypothetical protein